MIAIVGVAMVIAALGVVRWITAPAWVPAASGISLDLSGEMSDRLAESGIDYKLGRGGTEILVSESDLARARVALARDGLATGSRPGLELFDQQTWGWNDFTQRVNYRRAIEGELERTIGRIGGVERASVHIAIGERSAFRRADARGSTASVVLSMRSGLEPSAEVVRGVAQLVSSSVDGLSAENVSVHDITGRLWSESADGTSSALSARQLRVQREVESYLEQKAEAIVADVVGRGNARVRVSATLNFNRIERTTQSVDPARQAISSEQKEEIIPGDEGGAASTNIINAYENSRSTEIFSGSVGDVERLTVAVLVNDQVIPAADDDAPPTVIKRSDAELQQLESLVRGAIGLNIARGDGITVVSAPFERVVLPPMIESEAPAGFGAMVDQYQRPVINLVGILAVVIIGFLTINALKAPVSGGPALATAGASDGNPSLPASTGGSSVAVATSRPVSKISFPAADTQVRDRVVQTVEKDPDVAARLVKSWMKE